VTKQKKRMNFHAKAQSKNQDAKKLCFFAILASLRDKNKI
jgi:hypothetical protein